MRIVSRRANSYPQPGKGLQMQDVFAHPVERELAAIFDELGIIWEYEPHTFVLAREIGRPRPLRSAHGAWRSLVSALVWGTRGPEFKSRRPDQRKARKTGAFT